MTTGLTSHVSSLVLRPNEVRGANVSAILRLLIENGPMPRAQMSDALGLTAGAVTRIIAELTEQGLVMEGERISVSSPGRPRVPIDIIPSARLSIGVHIGVTFVHAALIDLRGDEVVGRRLAHDGSVESVIEICDSLIQELLRQADAPVLGVGVIAGGWIEPSTGILRRHDELNWHDVALRDELSSRTGSRVHVETSARAHALADIVFGEASGHSNFTHVFVGHVVEAAVVLDGHVHTGINGRGGSLGNWIVDDGSGTVSPASKVLSDTALVVRARAIGIIDDGATFEDLVDVANRNGPRSAEAVELLRERAHRVGMLISAMTDLIGPSLVIVSSGAATLPSSLEDVRGGMAAASSGLPLPELRTEANTGQVLTRAAASLVFAATVLA